MERMAECITAIYSKDKTNKTKPKKSKKNASKAK